MEPERLLEVLKSLSSRDYAKKVSTTTEGTPWWRYGLPITRS